MEAQNSKKKNKVGILRLFCWQSSAVSVSLSTLVLIYVTIYCTDTLGMPPALVGTLFMVSKLVDGVTDVLAGFIIDRTETRWGRGRPYEIFMVILWLSTWLLFSCPESFSLAAKSVWIFCMYVFMNAICVTFLNANNVVYLVRAFETKEQQVKLTAYGSFFTMGAAVIFNMMFPMAMSKVATSAAGWSRLIAMLAVPLTLLGIIRMLTIKEQYNNDVKAEGEKLKLADVFTLVKTNEYVVRLSLARFIANTVGSMGVTVYFWTYIVGNVSLMGVTSVTSIILLPLAFVLPLLRRKLGLGRLVIWGFCVSIAGYIMMFFFGGNLPAVVAATFLTTGGTVPFSMLFNIFLIDCADYNEWQGNPRMEGTLGSLTGFANKVGGAFGGFFLGIMLSLSGYDGTLQVQGDGAILMIRLLASVIPAVFYLVIILIMRTYKLDKELPKMKEEIEARRAAENSAEGVH